MSSFVVAPPPEIAPMPSHRSPRPSVSSTGTTPPSQLTVRHSAARVSAFMVRCAAGDKGNAGRALLPVAVSGTAHTVLKTCADKVARIQRGCGSHVQHTCGGAQGDSGGGGDGGALAQPALCGASCSVLHMSGRHTGHGTSKQLPLHSFKKFFGEKS